MNPISLTYKYPGIPNEMMCIGFNESIYALDSSSNIQRCYKAFAKKANRL